MPEPRDWADWMQVAASTLSPILTVAGFGVALWVAMRAGRTQRREQASKITAWLAGAYEDVRLDEDGRECWGVVINNASDQVAYDLLAQIVQVRESARTTPSSRWDAEEFGERVGAVPPGKRVVYLRYPGIGGMHRRSGIELAFQDAAGRFWFRAAQGTLVETRKHPVDFYELSRPPSWGVRFRPPGTVSPKEKD